VFLEGLKKKREKRKKVTLLSWSGIKRPWGFVRGQDIFCTTAVSSSSKGRRGRKKNAVPGFENSSNLR